MIKYGLDRLNPINTIINPKKIVLIRKRMSFSDDSSDPEWKKGSTRGSKIKLEPNLSLSKIKYSQKFCDKWMQIFNPWLARCDDDPNKPFCRACQCRLDCNRCHLQRHERTSKHARNLEILINRGEGAAKQNLSIRQERSKYYQQRKKNSPEVGGDTAEDYFDDFETESNPVNKQDPDSSTGFQFVQTESAPGDQYNEETVLKQETLSADDNSDPLPTRTETTKTHGYQTRPRKTGAVVKKERMKLLKQIHKNKNDLMDSFKDLMGGNFTGSPPKEKNHVDLFFESVSSSVKALSPKLIAETKMRVSQLICELELRALTENDPNAVAASGGAVVVSPESGGTFIINQQVHQGGVMHETLPEHHHQLEGEEGQHHYEALS